MELILREDCGGVQEFASKSEAILWAQRQAREWLDVFGEKGSRNQVALAGMNDAAREVYTSWKNLEASFETIDDRGALEKPLFGGRVQDRLVVAGSNVGTSLQWIKNNLDNEALSAAFVVARISITPVEWSSHSATAGVVQYMRLMDGFRAFDEENGASSVNLALSRAQAKVSEINVSVAKIEGRVAETQKSLDGIGGNFTAKFDEVYSAGLDQLHLLHDQQVAALSSQNQAAKDSLENFDIAREKGLEELENWRAAFREEVRLQPAARLWTGLAQYHRVSALRGAIASIAVGVIGIVLTPIIAFRLMKWIGVKFGEIRGAAPLSSDPGKVSDLVFHYQLIFSAAVTLLWLTMFLWLMRVIVRHHTLQRRLEIDAAGRAALTQTYLGLRQEGAVTENERAIVFASLFQPVTDNSVDDGPPATSLASILTAIAAGKSGTA